MTHEKFPLKSYKKIKIKSGYVLNIENFIEGMLPDIRTREHKMEGIVPSNYMTQG